MTDTDYKTTADHPYPNLPLVAYIDPWRRHWLRLEVRRGKDGQGIYIRQGADGQFDSWNAGPNPEYLTCRWYGRRGGIGGTYKQDDRYTFTDEFRGVPSVDTLV